MRKNMRIPRICVPELFHDFVERGSTSRRPEHEVGKVAPLRRADFLRENFHIAATSRDRRKNVSIWFRMICIPPVREGVAFRIGESGAVPTSRSILLRSCEPEFVQSGMPQFVVLMYLVGTFSSSRPIIC